MSLPGQLDFDRLVWRAAVHEAGHIVADHLHGFYPIETSIEAATEQLGCGRTDCRDRQAVIATVEKFVISCLAGPEAERALIADDHLTADGALGDLAKATRVLPSCPEQNLSAYSHRARALVLHDRNRSALLRIARGLASTKRLVGLKLQLVIEAAYRIEGAQDKLSTFERGGEVLSLGVLRSQGDTQWPPLLIIDALSDALVVGDLKSLHSGTPVSARPQNDDDLERVARLSDKGSVVLELLDGSGDVIPLKSVTIVQGQALLESY